MRGGLKGIFKCKDKNREAAAQCKNPKRARDNHTASEGLPKDYTPFTPPLQTMRAVSTFCPLTFLVFFSYLRSNYYCAFIVDRIFYLCIGV